MPSLTIDHILKIVPRIGGGGLLCLLTAALLSACDSELQPMATLPPTDDSEYVSTPTPSAHTPGLTDTVAPTPTAILTLTPTLAPAGTSTPTNAPTSPTYVRNLGCRTYDFRVSAQGDGTSYNTGWSDWSEATSTTVTTCTTGSRSTRDTGQSIGVPTVVEESQ